MRVMFTSAADDSGSGIYLSTDNICRLRFGAKLNILLICLVKLIENQMNIRLSTKTPRKVQAMCDRYSDCQNRLYIKIFLDLWKNNRERIAC